MIDAELATEYVGTCQDLLDAEDKVNKLIHDAGDASVLREWKHFNPDEIPAVLDVLRLDRFKNGKAIAAAVNDWCARRFAVHQKYAEVVPHAEYEQFLRLPKPDRVDRIALGAWQAYFSAASNL